MSLVSLINLESSFFHPKNQPPNLLRSIVTGTTNIFGLKESQPK